MSDRGSGKSAIFDRYKTEELLELMRRVPLECDVDMKYLDALLAAYEARQDSIDADIDAAWENYTSISGGGDFRYSVVIPENKTQTRPSAYPARRLRRNVWRGVLVTAVVVVLTILAAVVAFAVPQIRNAIADWTDEVFFFGSGNSASEIEYKSLPEALTAYGITEPLAPKWLPIGYELTQLMLPQFDNVEVFFAYYSNSNDRYITVEIVANIDKKYTLHELDKTGVKAYDKYGITHYTFTNNNKTKVTWSYDQYECTISITGDIQHETLIKIINSIYER